MAEFIHKIKTHWIGNKGSGTFDNRSYERDFVVSAEQKGSDILGSSDSHFHGHAERYNPQDLLISAVSSCHMLWYLNFCARNGVIVLDYVDEAEGRLIERVSGEVYGKINEVTINPIVTIADESNKDLALEMHQKAHDHCYIAKSCNFPVKMNIQIITPNDGKQGI